MRFAPTEFAFPLTGSADLPKDGICCVCGQYVSRAPHLRLTGWTHRWSRAVTCIEPMSFGAFVNEDRQIGLATPIPMLPRWSTK